MPGTLGPCGTDCAQCGYYLRECAGCAEIRGKVFWLSYTGEPVCDIYDCCINQKKLNHCGGCSQLPCARYEREDPTKTPEENAEDYRRMLAALRTLREEEPLV